jgi:1-acyl-sn-glycerol-3-phosphate acyltransferase
MDPMPLSTSWRALRTGAAFVVFGVCCLFVTLVAIPWVRLRESDPAERERRAQLTVKSVLGIFVGALKGFGLMRFRGEGLEALAQPGILVVANHPTLIDAPVLLRVMSPAVCVTKMANVANPFMGGVIAGAGYIPNQGGAAIVETAVNRLERGCSLLLFPEGTRSPEKRLGEFHRGAAHIALASQHDVLPVLITCDPPTLMRGQKWYEVPDRAFEFSVRVGDPIAVEPYREALAAGEPRGRVARRLNAELREFFEKGLERGAEG